MTTVFLNQRFDHDHRSASHRLKSARGCWTPPDVLSQSHPSGRWNKVFSGRLREESTLLISNITRRAPINRATECFSIYSDMSILTIACSSSIKTPPGLEPTLSSHTGWTHKDKRTDGPIGSCNPALPFSRHWRRQGWHPPDPPLSVLVSFHMDQFLNLPSNIFETGTPVHLETTSATSSSSTSSLSIFSFFWRSVSFSSSFSIHFRVLPSPHIATRQPE